MSNRAFTDQEVLAVVKAVIRAERTVSKRSQAEFRRECARLAASQEEGNRRLRNYVLTGDPKCLAGDEK